MSYRDDQEALYQRLDGVEREAERLRQENEAMRAAVGGLHPPPSMGSTFGTDYRSVDVRALPLEERARLAAHTVQRFPAWAVAVLNLVTFGLFPLIHFGLQHDRLPRAAENDPGSGKAIVFTFIPYYNFYWIFFNALRLCDRLDLQLKLRGRWERSPRGLVLAACILSVIPYVNIVFAPILWTIAVCFLQSTVNLVASLSPTDWDATVLPGYAQPPSPYAQPGMPYVPPSYPIPAVPVPPAMPNMAGTPYAPPGYVPMYDSASAERAVRARNLVVASHVLGWGGLVVAVVGGAGMSAAAGVGPGFAVGGIGAVLAIVGAILGQIGRGLQGRAI